MSSFQLVELVLGVKFTPTNQPTSRTLSVTEILRLTSETEGSTYILKPEKGKYAFPRRSIVELFHIPTVIFEKLISYACPRLAVL